MLQHKVQMQWPAKLAPRGPPFVERDVPDREVHFSQHAKVGADWGRMLIEPFLSGRETNERERYDPHPHIIQVQGKD